MIKERNGIQQIAEEAIEKYIASLPDDNLYGPVRYIMGLGGKRIRPVLVLLAAEAFGARPENALPAALAVEIFHNFSLVHDDIMDEAPLRRGKPTVHARWNTNAAILSGDVMLIEAYKQLSAYPAPQMAAMTALFNTTASEVCLGQQYDMDFEKMDAVTEERYIEMIGLKTAVLLGCSLRMGAMVANAAPADAGRMYDFGKMAGIGFQIQDDYLDAFGNPDSFGKQVGGDILANKKTLLSTYALQQNTHPLHKELLSIYQNQTQLSADRKVARVQEIFQVLGADRHALMEADRYFEAAEKALREISLPKEAKAGVERFLTNLRSREF